MTSGPGEPGAGVGVPGGQGVQAGDRNTQRNVFGGTYVETQVVQAPSAPVAGPAGGRVVVGEIPQEPAAFQERPELLGALTGAQPEGVRVRVVFAVTGLRGVGKSQLAAAYARQRLTQGWPVVAWLDASDREQLLAGYAQLAKGLGLADDGPDSAEAAARVRHWLEAGGEQCLLVLDNAVSADVLRPFVPAAGHAQVVVTSSRASLAALGVPVPVDVFTEAQAVGFLGERTGLEDEAGALGLARELGCLPLALGQAAAVIAGQRLAYAVYLQRLAAVTLAGHLARPEEDPYPHGTAEAITLAVQAAGRDDPGGLAGQLLDVIALLSPAGVSRTVLSAVGGDPADGAGPAEAGPEAVDGALGRLASWSLVAWSVDGSAVVAHRLVMRVARERAAADNTLAAAAGRAIGALGAVLPAQEDAWRHPALMQEFIQQVTALAANLDASPGLLAGQAGEGFLVLLGWVGWYLHQMSDLSRAIPVLERALADYQRVLGAEDQATLRSRNNLAGAYRAAGRLDEAVALHEQSLADRQRVLGPAHPDTLNSRNNLAEAYRAAGRLDEAIALHEQTLADCERVLGSTHPMTQAVRANLAAARAG
jgi:tetratricopeptide (TPR) repeat protein